MSTILSRLIDNKNVTSPLLARLHAFLFPEGEDRARAIRTVRLKQTARIRSAPTAPWIALTADMSIDATQTSFVWEARYKIKMGFITIVDAYEKGHGRFVLKLGSVLPFKKMTGPAFDRGEIQRYLANAGTCPPMLLNNPALEITEAGPNTLRLKDRNDPTQATIDLDIAEDGQPILGRAIRPKAHGNTTIDTPWSARTTTWQDWEGLRIASTVEAAWDLPEGPFPYFQAEVFPQEAVR